jgi:hypothetical protein
MKDRKVKWVLLGRVLMRGKVKGDGGRMWCMYFVFIYENRMRSVEILRREEGDEGEDGGGISN